MNRFSTVALIIACFALTTSLYADSTFQFNLTYESTDAGQIVAQQACSGWMTLRDNGTYQSKVTVDDSGTWRLQNMQGVQRIFFVSRTGSQFFGQLQGNTLGVWCSKTPRGTNVWIKGNKAAAGAKVAKVSKPQGAVKDMQKGLNALAGGKNATFTVKNGRVTKTALFGATSAGNYGYYDNATGELTHDQQGVILRPNGTYYFSSEFGAVEFKERGFYTIVGNNVTLRFDDGSSFVLTIMNGGKQLNYYSQGMLINEFLYMGTVPSK